MTKGASAGESCFPHGWERHGPEAGAPGSPPQARRAADSGAHESPGVLAKVSAARQHVSSMPTPHSVRLAPDPRAVREQSSPARRTRPPSTGGVPGAPVPGIRSPGQSQPGFRRGELTHLGKDPASLWTVGVPAGDHQAQQKRQCPGHLGQSSHHLPGVGFSEAQPQAPRLRRTLTPIPYPVADK